LKKRVTAAVRGAKVTAALQEHSRRGGRGSDASHADMRLGHGDAFPPFAVNVADGFLQGHCIELVDLELSRARLPAALICF
jgi:hypothetical protein